MSQDPIQAIDDFIAQQDINISNSKWKTELPKPPQVEFDSDASYFWLLATNKGDIKIELRPEVAPMHVSSTIYLTNDLQRFDSRTLDAVRRRVVDLETLHVGKPLCDAECERVQPGTDDQKLSRPVFDRAPSFVVHEALANRKRHHLPRHGVAFGPVGEASEPRFAVEPQHPRLRESSLEKEFRAQLDGAVWEQLANAWVFGNKDEAACDLDGGEARSVGPHDTAHFTPLYD